MANTKIDLYSTDLLTAVEGTSAIASYSLGSPLASSTTVRATVTGQPATAGEDYTAASFSYHMGVTVNDPWTLVPSDGMIILNAGYSNFQLKVDTLTDTLTEPSDALDFVVSQTAGSLGITDSWWVSSFVHLVDVAGPNLATHSIYAVQDDTPVPEGNHAMATYLVDNGSVGLGAASVVNVSVVGWPASADDYSALQFRTGTGIAPAYDGAGWVAVTDGHIALPLGTTNFQLRVAVAVDTLTEPNEAIAFVVSQTSDSVGIIDSWWVPNVIQLADTAGTGASVHLHSISAAATTSADEGGIASAIYNIDGTGGLGAPADVNVSVVGQPATAGTDFGLLHYESKVGANSWVDHGNVTGTSVTLPAGTTQFRLSVPVLTDNLAEPNEAVAFVVSQTAASLGITESWWVSALVPLVDQAGTGTRVAPHSISAAATTPAAEGGTASAIYNIDGTGGLGAPADVNVSVVGQPATAGTDFGALHYESTVGAGSWVDHGVVTGTSVTLPTGTTQFRLSVPVLTDHVTDPNEAVAFVVSQTTDSLGITDSWWLPSVVNLIDADSTGAQIILHTISAVEGSPPAVEGSEAIATYQVDAGGLTNSTTVNVTVAGLNATAGTAGSAGTDYSGFSYRLGTGGGWTAITSGDAIALPSGTANFQLKVDVAIDTLTETNESVLFTVAQSSASIGLVGSWYVPSSISFADLVTNTFTGAVGADIFTATANNDVFVIPAGTSLAQTGKFDTITALSTTDRIDVPGGILSDRTVWEGLAAGSNVASWLTGLGTQTSWSGYAAGELHVYRFTDGSAGIWINTDNNTSFDLATDTFIVLVGAQSLTAAQIGALLI